MSTFYFERCGVRETLKQSYSSGLCSLYPDALCPLLETRHGRPPVITGGSNQGEGRLQRRKVLGKMKGGLSQGINESSTLDESRAVTGGKK